ncbi:MAG: hypothetical protein KC635_09425 [Myxococcales bacterium]|nr:hypothetical protein [Myxococcales bacterium]MCB9731775.1 hypothetical protein [Deltaproteobacteria bacterium]
MNDKVMKSLVILLALAMVHCGTAPAQRDPDEVDAADVVPGKYVSKTRGPEGGIVVLWPRVVPKERTVELRPQATALQARLVSLVREAFPGREVEVRPEPERVCPWNGCASPAVGVLIVTDSQGCAAVVQVSKAGRAPARQMVWGGILSSALEVPFREPPESHVTVQDFVPCGELTETTKEREGSVKMAIEQAQ